MQFLRKLERTLSAGETPTLRVANERGDLTVIGEDRSDIAFVAQIAVNARDEPAGSGRLDAVAIPVEVDGTHVTIGPPAYPEGEPQEWTQRREFDDARGSSQFFSFLAGGAGIIATARRFVTETDLRVDMELRVPRRCTVNAELRAGTLQVSGIEAPVEATSRAGAVSVHDVSGDVAVETRSGHADVRAIRGSVSVDSRSGRLDVRDVGGALRVESRSGRVEIGGVDGPARVRARSGSLRIEDARGGLEIESHAGSVEVRGRVEDSIDIDVTAGSVRLAVPPDTRFFLDAESLTGSVRSDLPIGDGDPPAADAPTVRIRTDSGSIRVGPL